MKYYLIHSLGDRTDRGGVDPRHNDPVPHALQHVVARQAHGMGPLRHLEKAGLLAQGTFCVMCIDCFSSS